MKKSYFIFAITIFISLSTFAQIRVTTEGFLQIGYNSSVSKSLTFGNNATTGSPRGQWAMEYWEGGLNFWRPWPMTDAGSYKLFIADNGNIGIADGTPSYKLDVNGDIATYGTLRIASDKRFKSKIEKIDPSFTKKIMNLNGYSYVLNNKPVHGKAKDQPSDNDTISFVPKKILWSNCSRINRDISRFSRN